MTDLLILVVIAGEVTFLAYAILWFKKEFKR